jgi:hypothetical protein
MKRLLLAVFTLGMALTGYAQTTPTTQVKTIADLVALGIPTINNRLSALVTGRVTENDGGGGVFFYDGASVVTTNLGTVFKPALTDGRWVREYDGELNVKWFGAVSDGTDAVNTTLAIQNAIDSAAAVTGTVSGIVAKGNTVYIPAGIYAVDTQLWIGKSNLSNASYTLKGDGRDSTKLVWQGGGTNSLIAVYHPSPGQVNMNSVTLKDFAVENPVTGGDARASNVDGILMIGNVTPASIGNVAGINKALIENIRFEGFDNGLHVFGSVNEWVIQRNEFSSIYHQITTQTASLTEALTDRKGNCILFDGDYDGPTNIVTIAGQVWIKNNVFNAYQAYAVDVYRMSQMTFSENSIVMNAWTASKGLRVQQGAGGFISGNFTESSDGADYGPLFDLNSVAAGSSSVNGYTVTGNQISGPLNAAAGAGVTMTFASGSSIMGNSFNFIGKAIQLATTCTNIYIGINDYVSVTTKLTDAGAVNLVKIDPQLDNLISGPLTVTKGLHAGLLGGYTGGTDNNVTIAGASGSATTVGALQIGDNSAAGSRQIAISNGHTGASSNPGTLSILQADAINTDPLASARTTLMSITTSSASLAGSLRIGNNNTGNVTGGGSNAITIVGSSASAALASSLHFGDSSAGGSRQFAFSNGYNGTGQNAGRFFLLGATAVNTDPISASRNIIFNASGEGGLGIFTADAQPAATLYIAGAIAYSRTPRTTSLVIGTGAYYYIAVTVTGQTITLPAANSVISGRTYIIKSAGAAVSTTVALTGADTIDNVAASDTIAAQAFATYISDGTSNWEKL